MTLRAKILLSLSALIVLPAVLVFISMGPGAMAFIKSQQAYPFMICLLFLPVMMIRISRQKKDLSKYQFLIPMALWTLPVILASFFLQTVYSNALFVGIGLCWLICAVMSVHAYKTGRLQA
jgi:hypothetical protein